MSDDAPPGASDGIQGQEKVGGYERYGFQWDWNDRQNRESHKTRLSFGLLLFDSVIGELLHGTPDIRLAEVDEKPVRTPSGYYAYTNLPEEFDVLHLTVDAGEEYFVEERTVVLDPERADYDPDDPGVEVVDDPTEGIRIELEPTPAYRFPRTYTHLRGHVYDEDGTPVTDATVSMPEFDVSTRTVEKGEFALYVPVSKEQVHKTNGKKYVKLNGASNGNGTNGGPIGTDGHLEDPTVEVDHPEFGSHSGTVEIEAGTRTAHHVHLE